MGARSAARQPGDPLPQRGSAGSEEPTLWDALRAPARPAALEAPRDDLGLTLLRTERIVANEGQRRVLQELVGSREGALIVAPPKSGKRTMILMALAQDCAEGRAVYVVPSDAYVRAVMQQASEVLTLAPPQLVAMNSRIPPERRATLHGASPRLLVTTAEALTRDLASGAATLQGIGTLVVERADLVAKTDAARHFTECAAREGVRVIAASSHDGQDNTGVEWLAQKFGVRRVLTLDGIRSARRGDEFTTAPDLRIDRGAEALEQRYSDCLRTIRAQLVHWPTLRSKIPTPGELQSYLVSEGRYREIRDTLQERVGPTPALRPAFSTWCEVGELRTLHGLLTSAGRTPFLNRCAHEIVARALSTDGRHGGKFRTRLYSSAEVLQAFRVMAQGTPYELLGAQLRAAARLPRAERKARMATYLQRCWEHMAYDSTLDHPKEELVFDALHAARKAGERTIIFCGTAQHAQLLAERIQHVAKIPGGVELVLGRTQLSRGAQWDAAQRFADGNASVLVVSSAGEDLPLPKAHRGIVLDHTADEGRVIARIGRVGVVDPATMTAHGSISYLLYPRGEDEVQYEIGRQRYHSLRKKEQESAALGESRLS